MKLLLWVALLAPIYADAGIYGLFYYKKGNQIEVVWEGNRPYLLIEDKKFPALKECKGYASFRKEARTAEPVTMPSDNALSTQLFKSKACLDAIEKFDADGDYHRRALEALGYDADPEYQPVEGETGEVFEKRMAEYFAVVEKIREKEEELRQQNPMPVKVLKQKFDVYSDWEKYVDGHKAIQWFKSGEIKFGVYFQMKAKNYEDSTGLERHYSYADLSTKKKIRLLSPDEDEEHEIKVNEDSFNLPPRPPIVVDPDAANQATDER